MSIIRKTTPEDLEFRCNEQEFRDLVDRYAALHDLCEGGVRSFLAELGLPPQTRGFETTITVDIRIEGSSDKSQTSIEGEILSNYNIYSFIDKGLADYVAPDVISVVDASVAYREFSWGN